jgi:hypothetical protein
MREWYRVTLNAEQSQETLREAFDAAGFDPKRYRRDFDEFKIGCSYYEEKDGASIFVNSSEAYLIGKQGYNIRQVDGPDPAPGF